MTDQVLISQNYGVLNDGGLYFLHQGDGLGRNFIGYKGKSPFQVQLEVKRACPHNIHTSTPMPDRNHWRVFMDLYKDPLVSQFLPLPRSYSDPVPFVSGVDMAILVSLTRLSSPVQSLIRRMKEVKVKDIEADLKVTNAAPLLITDIKTEHQSLMETLAMIAAFSPRKLILSGDRNMVITPPLTRLNTLLHRWDSEEILSLPLESLGAVALRRWARGERVDDPWKERIEE